MPERNPRWADAIVARRSPLVFALGVVLALALGPGCANRGRLDLFDPDNDLTAESRVGSRRLSTLEDPDLDTSTTPRRDRESEYVTGRVIDLDGRPVDGAVVRVGYDGRRLGKMVEATTDQLGRFALGGLTTDATYFLIAEKDMSGGVLVGYQQARVPSEAVVIELDGYWPPSDREIEPSAGTTELSLGRVGDTNASPTGPGNAVVFDGPPQSVSAFVEELAGTIPAGSDPLNDVPIDEPVGDHSGAVRALNDGSIQPVLQVPDVAPSEMGDDDLAFDSSDPLDGPEVLGINDAPDSPSESDPEPSRSITEGPGNRPADSGSPPEPDAVLAPADRTRSNGWVEAPGPPPEVSAAPQPQAASNPEVMSFETPLPPDANIPDVTPPIPDDSQALVPEFPGDIDSEPFPPEASTTTERAVDRPKDWVAVQDWSTTALMSSQTVQASFDPNDADRFVPLPQPPIRADEITTNGPAMTEPESGLPENSPRLAPEIDDARDRTPHARIAGITQPLGTVPDSGPPSTPDESEAGAFGGVSEDQIVQMVPDSPLPERRDAVNGSGLDDLPLPDFDDLDAVFDELVGASTPEPRGDVESRLDAPRREIRSASSSRPNWGDLEPEHPARHDDSASRSRDADEGSAREVGRNRDSGARSPLREGLRLLQGPSRAIGQLTSRLPFGGQPLDRGRGPVIPLSSYDRATNILRDFRLPDLSGRPVRFSDLRADRVVLVFWSPEDRPFASCREALETLVALQERYDPGQLRVIGLTYSIRDDAQFLERTDLVTRRAGALGVNFPILMGGGPGHDPVRADLQVRFYPTMILLDRDGRILWRGTGSKDNVLRQLDVEVVRRLGRGAYPQPILSMGDR